MAVWEQIVVAMHEAHTAGRQWLTVGEITKAVQDREPDTNGGSIHATVRYHCINDPSKKHSLALQYKRNPQLVTDDPTMRGKRYRLLTEAERATFLTNVRDDLEFVSYVQVLEWLRDPTIALTADETDLSEMMAAEDFAEPEGIGGTALLEMHLQDYLHRNWAQHFPDLAIYEGARGREFQTSDPAVGIIDFLCTDREGNFVIIETKRNLPDRQAVGQLLGYMGWVGAKLSHGNSVRGVLIAGSASDALRMAVSAVPNLELSLYEIAFSLRAG